ncbi:hypothetical protein [Ectothiorhodospira variabilis]|uniref:hypothetical protein n=1 Tax=Ectothiorhodospira variabilis TaxID=505694 RepID=UPI001EFC019B|nr:hypothetical protein [Ectothiorhodospira variabilis]MCG5494038.1 hypothetical protein [Ectothiorhodospira variabilis]MCG5503432.1 hypothetical protein [Ectothiorhodospira variabilis]MCG5506480.1 hypothetical protein [Ectothiorhodospira variabilis]
MAAETPISPIHPTIPGRPVPEEGDDYRRNPRRRPEKKEPGNDADDAKEKHHDKDKGIKDKDKARDTPRPPKDQDPDHIDEYA